MRIGIVAGETSGDLLGATLVAALRARYPGCEFVGIAGPRMQAEGAQSWFPMERLSVMGYWEVLKHFRDILAIRKQLVARLRRERPDLFVGIDAPDFNLGVELRLKRAGIRTVHYVSPSIWAWRRERIEKIRRAADKVLCLFPFEPAIYRAAGIAAEFVGHPLADAIPARPDHSAAREQLRLPPLGTVIALLPGSRMSELTQHADLLVATARLLHDVVPDARLIVPLATAATRAHFEQALARGHAHALPITLLFGHAREALIAADAAIVASGTATLEAALAQCPMVITYRVAPLTYRMMMRRAYLPYVGLPNVLAGEFIVPELLQDDATPENLAQALINLLHHADARRRVKARFAAIHAELKQDTGARLVEALAPFLARAAAQPAPAHLPPAAAVAP